MSMTQNLIIMSLSKEMKYHFALMKNKVNKNGLCPIYLRILLEDERVNVSTKIFVKEKEWVNTKKKLTTNKEVENKLRLIEAELLKEYNKLITNELPITSAILKKRLLGEKVDKYQLLDVFKRHNEEFKSLIGKKYTYGSFKVYMVNYRHLTKFIRKECKINDIDFKDVNYSFIKKYETYLLTNTKCNVNGAMKHLQRLKKITNYALINGWIDKNPFSSFKIQYEKTDRGYLTEAELKKIADAELNESLSKVRDYFLFSCYTGISYVDIKNLRYEHIQQDDNGNDWIIQSRGKTNVQALIPLISQTKSILQKYRTEENANGAVFKVISNQKTNASLKDIATIAKVNKKISFHLARHTFATTVTLSKGVPIETVSKMLGHIKISTTQIYSRVLKEKILNDVSLLL
jgi:site-specific recombinase XerD